MIKKKIGFLGPEGTYTQEALEKYLNGPGSDLCLPGSADNCIIEPYSDITGLINAVTVKDLDLALAPIENSIEGTVNVTQDLLARTPVLLIEGEVILPVIHHLMVHQGHRGAVTRILSHPQGLAQCQNYLKNNYPGVPWETTTSTAEAARLVAGKGQGMAAVANHLAATRYGLDIIASDIQDFPDNETRFVLVGREKVPPSGRDKTSLAFSMAKDRPGGLFEILGEFAGKGINLTKIESRPSKKGLGDYLFFIDFEGHAEDEPAREVLDRVREMTSFYRLMGSYRRA